MSEEIYIDGVDVSGCAFYKLGVCISPINKSCKDCNDIDINKCYFKQLKRLEQENEENKHYLACMTEQRNKLQTENEKKDNLLKWLITQQYYIIPKKLKQKITEVLNG